MFVLMTNLAQGSKEERILRATPHTDDQELGEVTATNSETDKRARSPRITVKEEDNVSSNGKDDSKL